MSLKDLLKPHRVHLLGGVRDAGKTRFILPAMKAWQGCPPWAYVAGDRSTLDALDTIADLHFQPQDIPLIPAYGRTHKGWEGIVETLKQVEPLPEIVIIEAFQDLAESINKRNIVHEFMHHIDSYLPPSREFPNGLTILGMTGSPKQSARDRYPDPTQRIPGTSIWVERASTVLIVESAEKTLSLTGVTRKLYVCRKHGGTRLELDGAFNTQNRLVFPKL